MSDNEREQEGGALHPLRKARQEHHLSMRAAAALAGLDHMRLYEWEAGKHVPTLPYASLIAPVLGFESGAVVRAACTAWIAEHALHSHSLVFATEEQRTQFITAPLPARTALIGTTHLAEHGGYAVDLLSQGVLSEEIRLLLEGQFAPQLVEWNVRGQFEWNVEAAQQDDNEDL